MISAGDRIAKLPYVYGGGHGSFDAGGYDCSGSVSYVLHAAGLLSTPADSGGLESFGDANLPRAVARVDIRDEPGVGVVRERDRIGFVTRDT